MTDAEQFAIEHCRSVEVDVHEKYVLLDLRDSVAAITEISNYWDVLSMIPRGLPLEEYRAYKQAVADRCVYLVRESMSTAHEFDLR